MSNTIQLKSIKELMGVNYFIPAYQRGYRWSKSQIEDLLNDIYSFATKKNKQEKEFYCLQPIVVKKLVEKDLENRVHLIQEGDWETYEVIDGQQRLTSIRIILLYIVKEFLNGKSLKSRYNVDVFNIIYETRPNLKDVFENIDNISNENIDYSFITNGYKYVDEWFLKKIKEGLSLDDLCDSITRTLVYDVNNQKYEGVVQVIWYELAEDSIQNPIDTFIRINLGKIPLTNAELVKALLLQENIYGVGDLAELQQMEIAQEWDRIEQTLQDENFWWFLSNEEFEGSTRIEYLLNLYYQMELIEDPSLIDVTGNDNNQVFRFYNYLLDKNKNFNQVEFIWGKIKDLFDQINEWYYNPVWYHYIGYLIYKNKTVLEIFKWLKENEIKGISKTKSEFTILLTSKISETLKNIKLCDTLLDDQTIEKDLSGIKSKYLNINYKDSTLVRDILLLYNLNYIVNQSINNDLIYKFPFSSFKNMKDEKGKKITWDIEHIDSYTEKLLDKKSDQNIWLENALLDLKDLDENLVERIKLYLSTERGEDKKFDELYNLIKECANEKTSGVLKNNIGNLTLLDSKTNRGYGNSLFISKRRIIISKDEKGLFIPPTTRNVFLKYTNINNLKSSWQEEDIILYNAHILKTLSPFINSTY